MKKIILTLFILFLMLFAKSQNDENMSLRYRLIDTINTQLYVRETSPNRGPMVDKYLLEVNSKVGLPWCAAFVGSNFNWLNIKNPNSAWSPSYAMSNDIIWMAKKKTNKIELLPGDVVTFYYSHINRVGHVGFLEKIDKSGYFITVEGNTNGAGIREGDGVYKKKREPEKVHAVSRYIKIVPIE